LEEKQSNKVRQQLFYSIAEVYNYNISAGKSFDFGDKKVNYFENGFNSMINFEFKYDAQKRL
jgi:alpha-amylase